MTKTELGRTALLVAYLNEFKAGPRTLKQLEVVQPNPANIINALVKRNYVIKLQRGLYKWNATINEDYIKGVATRISTNWNGRNVYEKPQGKLIGQYTTKQLLDELNRRGNIAYDFKESKFVIL